MILVLQFCEGPMVLGDLSAKLSSALRSLNKPSVDTEQVEKCLKEISTALLEADVNVRNVAQIRGAVKSALKLEDAIEGEGKGGGANRPKLIQKVVFNELVSLLSPERKPFKLKKGKPNVVMFVGLQGAGKTTTCTKYAHFHQRKAWKTALVCADTFRAGAFDQLKQNATKARIPFYGSYTEPDPVRIAQEGVQLFKEEKYELIIVDTSGRHKQEAALFEEMQAVAQAVQPDEVIFVMDSHIGQACYDQASAFHSSLPVGSVIITKLDGHARGGGALSAVAATGAPIAFLGTGEHFDEFEKFEPAGFVGRLMGLGDLSGLADTVRDAVDLKQQSSTMLRMQQGNFTLRDLHSQLATVMKMGPLGKVMSMIPGMAGAMPAELEESSVARLRKFMVIMDSCTSEELDSAKPIIETNPSRCLRICRGSGALPTQLGDLLGEHRRMANMVSKMEKQGLMGKGGDLTSMTRNPKQVMAKLQSAIDPRILEQMGGAHNMLNIMKQMEKAEGIEGMNKQLLKAAQEEKKKKKGKKK